MASNQTTAEPTQMPTDNLTHEGHSVYRVSDSEFGILEFIWLLYCCIGDWQLNQRLRVMALVAGVTKMLTEQFYNQVFHLTVSWFALYVLGRLPAIGRSPVDICKTGLILCWMVLDIVACFWPLVKIACTAFEGVLAALLLAYACYLTLHLRAKPRRQWLTRVGTTVAWGSRLGGCCPTSTGSTSAHRSQLWSGS